MLAALKIFGGGRQSVPTLEMEPAADLAPESDSPPDSPPPSVSRFAREIKRIWFRSEGAAPSHIPTPQDDARALLRWVAEAGYAGEPVLATDMEKAYSLMSKSLRREAYSWQLVAEPLRELTGGRKEYTRIRLAPGGRKEARRRVYHIPGDAV
jgi:hypothetical protein